MARLPRLYFPGCAQHLIQRGNNREACFYDEADYQAYLSFLKEAAIKSGRHSRLRADDQPCALAGYARR